MCVILHAVWPALLVMLSFLLSTNISDALFGDVLGALQSLVLASSCLALPMARDAFFTVLAKAALPSCVVAALDHACPMPSVRLPVSLEGSLAGGTGRPHRHGLATLETRCACGRSSSSRFSLRERWTPSQSTVLEEDADYVLTTHGSSPAGGPSHRRRYAQQTRRCSNRRVTFTTTAAATTIKAISGSPRT